MNSSNWPQHQPPPIIFQYGQRSTYPNQTATITSSQYEQEYIQYLPYQQHDENIIDENDSIEIEEQIEVVSTNIITKETNSEFETIIIHADDYKKQKGSGNAISKSSIPKALAKAANENDGEVDDTVERKLRPACDSEYCRKAEFRFCSNFSEETRKKIFDEFWTNMNWDQRHIFVATHVFRKPNEPNDIKNSCSFIYTLRNSNGSGEQVCENMFLNTLALQASTIELWVQKYSIGGDGVSKYKAELKRQLATIKIFDPFDYDEFGNPKKKRKRKPTKKKSSMENPNDSSKYFTNNSDVKPTIISVQTLCEGETSENKIDDKKYRRKFDFDPNCPHKPPREKNTVKPEYWRCNIAKRLRLEGEDYYSRNSKTGDLILHKGKQLGKRCESNQCKISKLRNCAKISEETRENIFNDIWKRWDWNQRKIWVASMVKRKATSRKRTLSLNSRRQATLHYYLPDDNGVPVQVCRVMFLNTTAIGHHQTLLWINSFTLGSDVIETITSLKDADQNANDWLDALPKYFVGKKLKKCLDSYFKNIGELFKYYVEQFRRDGVSSTERCQIKGLLRNKNIIIVPQNDEICELCKNFGLKKPKIKTEETFGYHTTRIEKATAEKLNDHKKSQAGTAIVLQVHLQPFKTVPILRAADLHLKSKLVCNNLTIYNVKNNFSTCYFFSEDQCSQTDKNIESIFASIICEYIKEHCIAKLPIIIYSSGEVDQTRNIVLSNALLNLATMHNLTISQKFYEEGHSLVEDCYKPFQMLDRYINCKNKEIYMPSQLAKAMREIKRWPDIFTGLHLDYGFFNNYSLPEHFRYKSIHPGDGFDEKDACEIKYNSNGKIELKVDFNEAYMDLLQKSVKDFKPILEYPKLYTEMAVIPKSKWEDLQDLKKFMPFDCQPFYDSLKYYED